MKRRLLLDVVVRERPAILELLAREDEALLVRGNALLVLNPNHRGQLPHPTPPDRTECYALGLDVVDGIRGLDFERDGLSGESC